MARDDVPTQDLSPMDGPTEPLPPDSISPGQTLDGRYEIRELLGRGGMGEVWRAFDLKLRVEVALKSLVHSPMLEERAREMMRREVRTAREVISPNVCRIFDLIEVDGQELVSMEYIDGVTLLDHLVSTGPLELTEAARIASQLLAGLEAIHDAGLVHRDVKPENIMLTRAGRLVLMDFGLAKGVDEGGQGTIAGTPAYMAPEQMRGEAVDARVDIFAAGVVLAELIDAEKLTDQGTRTTLRAGLHEQPPRVLESVWSPVISRAVAKQPQDRYASARDLARALESLTQADAGQGDERNPYPGLAAFAVDDAEYFFGREAEVEGVWRKLRSQHLLAVVGASGAGKSSFLRAGLLATCPEGWGVVLCTPGAAPFKALAAGLVAELSGDVEAMQHIVHIEDPDHAIEAFRSLRRKHEEILLIVDQFEELYTLNPAEVQASFSELLGQLAIEADVHVLLAMRDDFLFRCEHEALAPILSDLTLLPTPSGAALRRALVQPALLCGYRFEDEALVDEMLGQVAEERGALPLLAFAAAALWAQRDREGGLLTREAYERIGGVSGALSQHAEETLEQIGASRRELVREMFRNLVTAEGTRAVRDRQELLSVFEDRDEAEEVLSALVDARLVTSFDVGDPEDELPTQNIEIVHESLLDAWPRLVRWRTRDADAAKLRDQLRQAAQLWKERGHPDDLLWTGTSFREFQLWRERYPGGLSEVEERFARASTLQATRRKRTRRAAVAAALVLAAIVSTSLAVLWQRSETAFSLAALETGAQREVGRDPSAAAAYLIERLDSSESENARRLAVEVLGNSPLQRALPFPSGANALEVGEDWVLGGHPALGGDVTVFSTTSGSLAQLPEKVVLVGVSSDGTHLLTRAEDAEVGQVWSLPELALARELPIGHDSELLVKGDFAFSISHLSPEPNGDWRSDSRAPVTRRIEKWSLETGESRFLRRWKSELPGIDFSNGSVFQKPWDIHPSGRWLFYAVGRQLVALPLERPEADGIVLATIESPADHLAVSPKGRYLVILDDQDRLLLWELDDGAVRLVRRLETSLQDGIFLPRFDPSDRWLGWGSDRDRAVFLWDLEGPEGFAPQRIGLHGTERIQGSSFDPQGTHLATATTEKAGTGRQVSLLPLDRVGPRIFRTSGIFLRFALSSDGSRLISCQMDGSYVLPLSFAESLGGIHKAGRQTCAEVAIDSQGELALVSDYMARVHLVSIADGSTKLLSDQRGDISLAVALATSRHSAFVSQKPGIVRYDLQTGERTVFAVIDEKEDAHFPMRMHWAADGSLYSVGFSGVLRWDVDSGASEILLSCGVAYAALSPDGRQLIATCGGPGASYSVINGQVIHLDLESGEQRTITTHGVGVQKVAFHPSGRYIVTGDDEGTVRVGPVTGEEPHLLLGHGDNIADVAVTPDGEWVISGAGDQIRMWPMPDLDEPPLHTLPRRELLDRLREATTLRLVEDPSSDDGWRVRVEPPESP